MKRTAVGCAVLLLSPVVSIAGDVAILANEVTAILKALRQNGIDIVAIHHHMTGTSPTIKPKDSTHEAKPWQ
jgi:phosphopantothenate synthetase